ncbi:D-tyrosyl-tRNA(Tyr) deacylase [Candidatus Peregrinibacteria bacterium]|nr:D-tyrosyl-tRNA(Tyr) deacylase [Candidatus Peregrinibacteria bacterium]
MKALIQRVSKASVTIDGKTVGKINTGLLVFLGVEKGDTREDATFLIKKITQLRVFPSERTSMDVSLQNAKGALLIVSQFTLCGSTKKGRRPDFSHAATPEKAQQLYDFFIEQCRMIVPNVQSGEFGAMMDVHLVNDGPVTFMIES